MAGQVTDPVSPGPVRFTGDRLGSWLVGDERQATSRLVLRVRLVLTACLVGANAIGAVVVVALTLFVLPGPSLFHGSSAVTTFVVLPAYILLALGIGGWLGTRRALNALGWVRRDDEPDDAEAAATFDVPRRLTFLQAQLWGAAVVLFTVLYGLADAQNIPRCAFGAAFGGVVVCANAFLLSELALRPVTARALRAHVPRRRAGVRGRLLLAWGLGSAIPVVGLMTVAVFAIVQDHVTVHRLAVTVLALGLTTLAFGCLLTSLAGGATVGPIRAVRAALGAIAGGDLDVEVGVDDGTELGELQTGFNAMAAGLRERDRLSDLFGRHVGRAVAMQALASTPELGGEERYVAALFVDLIGSTALASELPPGEVVALLNQFFTVVVEEVERQGGMVNKFIGDAVLAVFGAPTTHVDPAAGALSAARCVVERLGVEVPECQVGAGVAAGTAIAGNIGTRSRFEYTVIGDPVNEAARLSELAKGQPFGLLASGTTVDASAAEERVRWSHLRDERLRGRAADTRIFRVA